MTATLTVVLALAVGVSLGLLGGGGSILAVPLLVYVGGLDPHEATAGSLFVVGVTSGVGLLSHARAGRVRWRTGLLLGAAGMAGAYGGGRVSALVPGPVLLGAFALMMLAAAVGMLRGRRGGDTGREELRVPAAIGLGTAVGVVTGFVGAGGGFVIVPTLVLVAGLPMTAAVGTSLLVITLQSAAGLAGHLAGTSLPWPLVLAVTASAVLGSLAGSRLAGRIPADRLRRAFAALVLAIAALVLVEQVPAGAARWTAAAVAVTLLSAGALLATARTHRWKYTPRGIQLTLLTDPQGPATPHTSTRTPSRQETQMSDPQTPPATARPSTMVFTQYYVDCLSQASYLVGDTSTGQAVVVDPRRDVQEYLDDAKAQGLTIVGMVNTHFHADFLSGHLELAKATGAWIGYGRVAQAEFETRALADGERISLGDVTLEIMETPGHTPESISVLVYEHADDEVAYGVLTGDALFIGDVGRPDLLASIGVTADELGIQLYDSIQRKLMGLPDAVRVFPAHGAGSACGKNLSTERQSTIGQQRLLNYACQPMSQEDFVTLVTAGQPSAPEYFVYDAILNRKNREVYDADAAVPALDAAAFDAAVSRGATVLDTRDVTDFAAGHLRGSLNVPADGRFAETAGMVLTADQEVVVVAPDGREAEVATRLARIGFDKVVGYLARPEAVMLDRPGDVDHGSRLTPGRLAELTTGEAADAADAPVVVDVRNIGEREGGHIPGSLHIPLAELRRRMDEIPAGRPVVLHCAGGWRSSVAASLLRNAGRSDVSDLVGGFAAWQAMNEPVSA
nr:TSUP family transporter [Kineosporia sp. R_H_3]